MRKIVALFTPPPPLVFPLLCILAMTTSCASIVSDSYYPVSFSSRPAGANITVASQHGHEIYVGTTPATVTLPAEAGFFSKARYKITIEKDGHAPRTFSLDASLDGWVFGNILFGGLIGLAIDAGTGSMWKLPANMVATLTEETALLILKHRDKELRIAFVDGWSGEALPSAE